jgi:hypothetical protein
MPVQLSPATDPQVSSQKWLPQLHGFGCYHHLHSLSMPVSAETRCIPCLCFWKSYPRHSALFLQKFFNRVAGILACGIVLQKHSYAGIAQPDFALVAGGISGTGCIVEAIEGIGTDDGLEHVDDKT